MNLKNANGPRLKLQVTGAAENILRGGHPWLFSDSVRDQNRPGVTGELGVVYDRNDRFLGIGLYDPDGPIRLRMLHVGKPLAIDEAWWRGRLSAAIERRRGLFDDRTHGFRLCNGESDGWPGMVLDRYGGTLVLKIYTAAWFAWLRMLRGLLAETLPCERAVLRLSRNIQRTAAACPEPLADGQVLYGSVPDGPVVFLEDGLRFHADVLRGQKTGFFLDQRENRRRVGDLARGREVLNVFSFSGGFSLHAARGGAASVTDLDISPHALESAQGNFALNRDDPAVAACRHVTVQADAFEWLAAAVRQTERYGLIVVDPPSLARRESERAEAIRAYGRLARSALAILKPGGILVASSCSAHVSAEEFFGAVRAAARQSGRPVAELQTAGHPPDHPALFPEANYLKAIYLRA